MTVVLVARVQARYLLMAGLAIVAHSMFYMAGYNLQIDFWDAVAGRDRSGTATCRADAPLGPTARPQRSWTPAFAG